MRLDPWELDIIASMYSENLNHVEEKVWDIVISVLNEAVESERLEDYQNKRDWVTALLKYEKEIKNKSSKPIKEAFRLAIDKLQADLDDDNMSDMDVEEKWLLERVKEGLLNAAIPINKSKKIKDIINKHQLEDIKYLQLASRNMTENAFKTFKNIINDSVTRFNQGNYTTEEAVAAASIHWADVGIPALIDRGGKNWSPDVYTRLVVSNAVNQLNNDLEIGRFEEYGGSLVRVSSHAACRPTHLAYQDNVYSIKDNDPKYPYLNTATNFGSAGGLCGINCRHYLMPFVGDKTFKPISKADAKSNAEEYKNSQNQRRLENSVRKAKRRYASAKKLGDNKLSDKSKKLVNKRNKRLRDFTRKHGLPRNRVRERNKI